MTTPNGVPATATTTTTPQTYEECLKHFINVFNHRLAQRGYSRFLVEEELQALELLKPHLAKQMESKGPYVSVSSQHPEEIKEFRETIKSTYTEMTDTERAYLTDDLLARFLVAREFKIEASLKMIINHLNWRKTELVQYSSCPACDEYHYAHSMRPLGFSKDHAVIIYCDFKHSTRRDATSGTAHFIVQQERFIQVMEKLNINDPRFVFIINFEGFSFRDMDPRMAKVAIVLLGDNYPERLSKVVLINSPSLFHPVFKVVQVVAPPETVKKISFVNTSSPDADEILNEIFDPEQTEIIKEAVESDKEPWTFPVDERTGNSY